MGLHKLQSFGWLGPATKRAKGGYKATTASSWVKVKPLRAKSAAQIKTRRAPNADSNGGEYCCRSRPKSGSKDTRKPGKSA
ncbi:BQ5605_C056g12665 [Microbotryum silenes-dioicae]|uniref:BQ5605_C056g12665 protein n=1 Tax=Microbotryum silenes-dioicae TaxID=796604 RepID=A0A2X0MRI8_9BASI|nr:BQ5605_C056g12665 [Microbotryum silenes-dioicae]